MLSNALCNLDSLPIISLIMDSNVLHIILWMLMMLYHCMDIFLTYCFIYLVWITTIIGSFLSPKDSDVGLDVSITVIKYFKYSTRKMMYLGFFNYWSTYCFRVLLNFLYCSLASLCSAVVPQTEMKSSTYPLKFLIDNVYTGQLKFLTHLPQPSWPLLLELNSLVVSRPQVVVVSSSSPLFFAVVVNVYVSVVMSFPF